MAKLGSELVAIYHYGDKKVYVYGCWDGETAENEFDFFDLHDENGVCLTEGEPFDTMPTRDEVKGVLDMLRR